MKTILTIIILFFSSFCFGQTEQHSNAEYYLTIAYRPATIQILTDTNSFPSTIVNNIGKITYIDVKAGMYKIKISGQGRKATIKDSIFVKEGEQLVLNFKIDGPCLYDHPAGYIPTCPKNHSDNIISIVYGLIVSRGDTYIKDNKDMKVKYAGCVTTGCDPQFYCKEHNIKF